MEGLQTAVCEIQGMTPCLMNNGQKADSMNEYAKQMKAITSTRRRGQVLTDEQAEKLAKLEFMGALYVDEKGRPCWPGENLEAMLYSAAKKFRRGPDALIGLWVIGNFALEYDGPKDTEKLWADKRFVKRCMVRQKDVPVMRTRPIFTAWSLRFVVTFNAEVLDLDTIRQWLEKAGSAVGLSDWRPKFGQFRVLSVTLAATAK